IQIRSSSSFFKLSKNSSKLCPPFGGFSYMYRQVDNQDTAITCSDTQSSLVFCTTVTHLIWKIICKVPYDFKYFFPFYPQGCSNAQLNDVTCSSLSFGC
ncbi:hypothetical protein STEG23_034112, partial [Scotinomys teguina]